MVARPHQRDPSLPGEPSRPSDPSTRSTIRGEGWPWTCGSGRIRRPCRGLPEPGHQAIDLALRGRPDSGEHVSLLHPAELPGVTPFDVRTDLLRHPREVAKSADAWMPWNNRHILPPTAWSAAKLLPRHEGVLKSESLSDTLQHRQIFLAPTTDTFRRALKSEMIGLSIRRFEAGKQD